ncbi:MAG TPA: VRR-NUC domain-containing protein [Steroidobacteraceae bacterium]|nr:VRR-NUC domain-containing protein [Steroidobacteraceae bacterium]
MNRSADTPVGRVLEPLYYLRNFTRAMEWLAVRYADLLCEEERNFIHQFRQLPEGAQALLVRLVMRRGDCFRSTKIDYPEIGEIDAAATPLIALAWLDPEPRLTIEEVFALLRRVELSELFPDHPRSLTKAELLEKVLLLSVEPRTFATWCGPRDECVYRVTIANLCCRLRLLFFGSFYQDWSEFVLADLGIFKYEAVEFSPGSRAFQCRSDVEYFYRLYECREQLQRETPIDDVLALIPSEVLANEWLESRRAKLLFRVAYQLERDGDYSRALEIYRQSSHTEARVRAIRVLERIGSIGEACTAAEQALQCSASGFEVQMLKRMLPRLRRRVTGQRLSRGRRQEVARMDLELAPSDEGLRVEEHVRRHLESANAPVFYVENALINSLFGLLCWDAIFAPVRGAFFHPFHSAPMDLLSAEFRYRREALFDRCLQCLADGSYVDVILANFKAKSGTASPFVAWGLMNELLLDLSLSCIPAAHLRVNFERILSNIRENCTGFPDLVQFYPQEKRYRMIEVKGPGDRLQDNQKRWLEHCATHEIPISVVYVSWAEARA